MNKKLGWLRVALGVALASTAWCGTFGKAVAIGGHAADLALDEARGVLYVANFTANRVDILSLASGSVQTSINVPQQPSSLALSADGRYLVVAHYGNYVSTGTQTNALTVVDLANSNARQTYMLSNPPLGVAFGIDNLALVLTTTEFLLFDPLRGTTNVLTTIAELASKTLPQPPANFPPQIVAASLGVSWDKLKIYGLTDTIHFSYDVTTRQLKPLSYTSSPAMGPRAVSVNQDGSIYAGGWGLFNARGNLVAQFLSPSGQLNVGSHAIDSNRGVIYAQVPVSTTTSTTTSSGTTTTTTTTSTTPLLKVHASDNLAVQETLRLPENLAGKSVLSSDGSTMYSVSDSGVMILPVGSLAAAPRLTVSHEDVVFQSTFCERRVLTKDILINDPSGNGSDFTISSSTSGVSVSPSSGTAPASVRITVDPTAFQNTKGTVTANLALSSRKSVNVPASVRVLINMRDPDQRGTVVNVPGQLVDLVADPSRDRFYILRQDTNQVLVYDGTSYSLVATLRTGNTPTQMAVSFDRRYLFVGNDNSQLANVYDLETLATLAPIYFPGGHYPRSLASSGRAILAACRVAGAAHTIDRVDMYTRTAVQLPSLGVYNNDINLNTMLVASGNGSSILAAEADGNLLLYNANVDTFTISRKDSAGLTGAYAASSYDMFVVGNALMNASLVPIQQYETGSGLSSGFVFIDQTAIRTTAPSSSSPGVIQRVDLSTGELIKPTRMVEAPLLGQTGAAFTRTLAPLASRKVIVNLTTSGFTALAWNYDASVAPPVVKSLVNAADGTQPVAPGGLVSIYGQNLSPINIATKEIPLPTALGDSCLTVNGVAVPMLFVSPTQINAQLPYNLDGNVTMILRTPGGVSDNYNFTMLSAAPKVFLSGVAGTDSNLPTIFRAGNGQLVTLSNPVHPGDTLVIYLTGMGRTYPEVDDGVPAPSSPLAWASIPPDVDLAGVSLPVLYAGLTPEQIGVYQINVVVPHWVSKGFSQPLKITQGSVSTTLNVRVVE
jgi:uncharacterized protein (TIGR03437 family)